MFAWLEGDIIVEGGGVSHTCIEAVGQIVVGGSGGLGGGVVGSAGGGGHGGGSR